MSAPKGKPSDVRFKTATTELMLVCLRCGALVGDERRHREWHAQLNELVQAIGTMIVFGG